MLRVIGLAGAAGSGKSTVARMLVNAFGAVPCALADYFKIPAVAMDGLPATEVFGPRPKSEATRHFLQRRGTEQGRDVFGADIWVRHLDAHLYRLHEMGVRRVVVDDVRFANEAAYIRQHGEVWRLVGRGGLTGDAAAHRSEQEIASLPVGLEIDNAHDHARLWAVVEPSAVQLWGAPIIRGGAA